MNHADPFIAALILVLMGIVVYCVWRAKRGRKTYIRPIAGISAMDEAIGRATEMGRPILFVAGYTDIQAIETHNSMAVLAHVGRLAARMRTQLVALIPVPNVFPLAEATLRQAYLSEGAPELFQPQEQVRFLSDNSVVFAAGVARWVEEEKPGCVIFFGAFDFTALLLSEPGARQRILQIAGDPSLFQMPFFVCTCDHTIIGEEFYAAGAYVSPDPKMRNSLLGQDLVKLVFVAIIAVGLLLIHLLPVKPAVGKSQPRGTWFVELLRSYR